MPVRVLNVSRGALLADRGTEATSFWTRFKGLLGKHTLAAGEALHIVPCTSIHTFFMAFSIDALFLADDGRVVKAYPTLAPWRVSGIHPTARSVLELPAGTIAQTGTREGDILSFERF